MDHLPFGPPYPVSPIIRGARFAFLFAGILYGVIKQKKYELKEEIWRAEEAKRKIIRDQRHAQLKAQIAKEEKHMFDFSVPPQETPKTKSATTGPCPNKKPDPREED